MDRKVGELMPETSAICDPFVNAARLRAHTTASFVSKRQSIFFSSSSSTSSSSFWCLQYRESPQLQVSEFDVMSDDLLMHDAYSAV